MECIRTLLDSGNYQQTGETHITGSVLATTLSVLAPTLFYIFLSAMIEEAFRDMGDGVYIQSRQNEYVFTVAHFRAKAKTTNILVRELFFFADDRGLIAYSAEEIQRIVDAFTNASSKFGLKINIKNRSDVPTELYNDHAGGH